MKISLLFFLFTFGLMAAKPVSYTMKQGGSSSILKLIGGNKAAFELDGGSAGNRTESASADCHIRGPGTLKKNTFTGTVDEIAGIEGKWEKIDKANGEKKITIQIKKGSAKIEGFDTLGICGLNTNFNGSYQKDKRQ